MPNYIRNHNSTYGECAPVGIFNVCNYFGANLTRKHDFENIRHLSGHIPHQGTSRRNYAPLIHRLFNCHEVINPTLADLDQGLDNGQIVLISYRWSREGDMGNHVAVIIGRTNKFYRCLNVQLGKTEQLYKRESVANDLLPKRNEMRLMRYSKAYFIEGVR